jgi:hypothetical protein
MQIFAAPSEQAEYERIVGAVTDLERQLARMLYATERAGSHDAFDGMPYEHCAPVYQILAANLIRNETNRAAIMAVLEKTND